jgi:hypothetical protein
VQFHLRAAVRPRILSSVSGASLLLEDEIAALLANRRCGLICITGNSGCGKSIALDHLEAHFAASEGIKFPEKLYLAELPTRVKQELVVYAAQLPLPFHHLAVFELAPWRDDELIEYLLAVHKDSCASVMSRITDEDRILFAGLPELWVAALNGLALNESCRNGLESLWQHILAQLPSGESLKTVNAVCLALLDTVNSRGSWRSPKLGLTDKVARLMQHRAAQDVMVVHATPTLMADGATFDSSAILELPCKLIERMGAYCKGEVRVLARLRELVTGPPKGQALAASLLHHAGTGWRPADETVPVLRGARLAGAKWPAVQLPEADLSGADFRHAILTRANLQKANLQ